MTRRIYDRLAEHQHRFKPDSLTDTVAGFSRKTGEIYALRGRPVVLAKTFPDYQVTSEGEVYDAIVATARGDGFDYRLATKANLTDYEAPEHDDGDDDEDTPKVPNPSDTPDTPKGELIDGANPSAGPNAEPGTSTQLQDSSQQTNMAQRGAADASMGNDANKLPPDQLERGQAVTSPAAADANIAARDEERGETPPATPGQPNQPVPEPNKPTVKRGGK